MLAASRTAAAPRGDTLHREPNRVVVTRVECCSQAVSPFALADPELANTKPYKIQIYTSNLACAPISNSPCADAPLDEVSSIPDCLSRDSSPQVKQTGYRLRHFTTHLHRPVAGLSSRLRTMAPLAYLYTVGTYNRYLLIGAHACAERICMPPRFAAADPRTRRGGGHNACSCSRGWAVTIASSRAVGPAGSWTWAVGTEHLTQQWHDARSRRGNARNCGATCSTCYRNAKDSWHAYGGRL